MSTFIQLSGGSGSGDMLKSVYDPQDIGIVLSASKEMVDVINKTGSPILEGSIVYLKSTSSSGTHPEILLADADTEPTSSKTLGAVYETIANNATGYVVTSGEVDNLDTSMYSIGSKLWLSQTAGQVTTTPPVQPAHTVFIGTVTRSQNGNGRILYAIQNGYELNELHDVLISSGTLANNDVLTYESSTALWKNKPASGLPAWVETNATDLTVWNNGKGNVLTNTSFGDGALRGCLGGDSNTAIGYQSLYSLTYAQFNVAVGRNALKLATSGGYNTAIGNDTLDALTTATSNVAVGYNSLSALTTGGQNTAVGHGSASLITTGTQNTAIGQGALDACTTGGYNVALGVDALGGITTSSDNVGIGTATLRTSTTGFQNTAVGNYAMYRLTTGAINVALGYLAGENTTTGTDNNFFGYQAGAANTTGIRNIFIGTYSGAANTTGGSNTVIGNDTNTGNFSGCVIIGRGATATAGNQFVVGSAGINAGTVTTESLSSTKTWSVKINGTDYKILLA